MGINRASSELVAQQIVAISDAAVGIKDVVPLWYGESDLPTPKFICDAAKHSLDSGATLYPRKRGEPKLVEAIDAWLDRNWGVRPGFERISVTASGMAAIRSAFELILEPGDNAVCVVPLWPNAEATIRFLGAEARTVALELNAEGEFFLDPERIFHVVDDRTRAIFINTPNNPSGYVASQTELRGILEDARRQGIWVISDEVYSRLTADGNPAPSMISLVEPEDRAIIVHSFSKSYCMTGWRLGFVVHPAQVGFQLSEMIELGYGGSPSFVQAGGIAALGDGEDFIRFFNEYKQRGAKLFREGLIDLPGLRLAAPPAGAFYTFVQVDTKEENSFDLCLRLVKEAGVGGSPGTAFGGQFSGWMRFCHARDASRLEVAIDRLRSFFLKQT